MLKEMKVSLRNGRLIDPANGIDREVDLHCADGKVLAIGAAPAGFLPDRTPGRPRSSGLPRPGGPLGTPARTR